MIYQVPELQPPCVIRITTRTPDGAVETLQFPIGYNFEVHHDSGILIIKGRNGDIVVAFPDGAWCVAVVESAGEVKP